MGPTGYWPGRGMNDSDAEMALNEMVTNAVTHGSGDVHADITHLGSNVRLEVRDQR
jgi:anti-sigma regulatory factor (Ser/Thr protein kinase)